jgi:hypothetical protein
LDKRGDKRQYANYRPPTSKQDAYDNNCQTEYNSDGFIDGANIPFHLFSYFMVTGPNTNDQYFILAILLDVWLPANRFQFLRNKRRW